MTTPPIAEQAGVTGGAGASVPDRARGNTIATARAMVGMSDFSIAQMVNAGNPLALDEAKRRRLKCARTARPQSMVSSEDVSRMIERQEIAPIIKQRLIAEIIEMVGGKAVHDSAAIAHPTQTPEQSA